METGLLVPLLAPGLPPLGKPGDTKTGQRNAKSLRLDSTKTFVRRTKTKGKKKAFDSEVLIFSVTFFVFAIQSFFYV